MYISAVCAEYLDTLHELVVVVFPFGEKFPGKLIEE